MKQAKQTSQSNLSLPPDTYIYSLKPISSALAVSCSDKSVRLVDYPSLKLLTTINTSSSHSSISALDTDGSTCVYVGGSDGSFSVWDTRSSSQSQSQSQQPSFRNMNQSLGPISAISLSESRSSKGGGSGGSGGSGAPLLALGTELTHHQAVVTVYDLRSPDTPLLKLNESHNDDVTVLSWSPYADGSRYLMSGGTDALVNLYDTSQSDPDDALVKILNAGSSVNHAGFLATDFQASSSSNEGREAIYSVSHDEQMTVWQVPVRTGDGSGARYVDSEDDDVDDQATTYGDVRPLLECEYVVGVEAYGGGMVMGVGKHSDARMDLLPVTPGMDLKSELNAAVRLQGAHGEEIVRSFYVDQSSDVIYTGGEDGMVKCWKVAEDTDVVLAEEKSPSGPIRGGKKRDSGKARLFKPY